MMFQYTHKLLQSKKYSFVSQCINTFLWNIYVPPYYVIVIETSKYFAIPLFI